MNDAKFTTNVIIKSIQVILEEKEKNKERKGLGKDGEKGGREEGRKKEGERGGGRDGGRQVSWTLKSTFFCQSLLRLL